MKVLDVKGMQFTHAILDEFMPWYSGWLDNGDGQPESYSIMLASMLNAVETLAGLPDRKVYEN